MKLNNLQLDKYTRGTGIGKWFKKLKARLERRKAKQKPDAQPTYGKYKGWVS